MIPDELRPGDRIIERHKQSTVKTVEEVVPGEYIIARGFNRRRISWRTLKRFNLA